MQLDIRLPIGLMFSVLGVLLVVVGLVVPLGNSQSLNVNLWWGAVMFFFGAIMFVLGRRGTATARLAEESPEGKEIEEIEQRSGLEKEPLP
jgi:membrane protein implicated in regulation of membrane protease activity